MSLSKTLEQLEEKYYGELEEERGPVIEALAELHDQALSEGYEAFREFSDAAMGICGGIYIPYIMWVELGLYMENTEERTYIYKIMQAFVESGFEEPERKKMKPLLIAYFAIEKEFEINKIMALIVEKAHPTVQEYFKKVLNFVSKNKNSVDMYTEKFNILKVYAPSFELLRMPVIKLKEHLDLVS